MIPVPESVDWSATELGHEPRRAGFGAALWPGLWLSGLLAALAFALSFSALTAVGVASGIDAALGWAFPLIIDGFILLATWAAWRFRAQGLRGSWYPWAAFIVFSAVSMTGNALHAHPVPVNGLLLDGWAATAFSTVPSVALLVASHMLLLVATHRSAAPSPATEPVAVDEAVGDDVSGHAERNAPLTTGDRSRAATAGHRHAVSGDRGSGQSTGHGGAGVPGGDRAVTVGASGVDRSAGHLPDPVVGRVAVGAGHPRLTAHAGGGSAVSSQERTVLRAVPTPQARGAVVAAIGPGSVTEPAQDAAMDLTEWVAGQVAAGEPVTGQALVVAGLAASESTARRRLRALRTERPDLFEAQS